jgi:hypothetical protein
MRIFGISVESTLGRKSVILWSDSDRSRKGSQFIRLGFGATLLASYGRFQNGRISRLQAAEVKAYFLKNLESVRAAKSLDIRTRVTDLDIRPIENFRRLRALRLNLPIAHALNLHKLKRLKALHSSDIGFKKISGLNELKHLRAVSVVAPSPSWLSQLPQSLEMLFLRNKIHPGLDISRYASLKHLGVAKCRKLDFGNRHLASLSLEQLDLVAITTIEHLEEFSSRFPNLRSLNFVGSKNLFESMLPYIPKNCTAHFLSSE